MKTFKHLLIVAAGSVLLAGQALAVPINTDETNGEDSLQTILDNITYQPDGVTLGGPSSIDVTTDQVSPSSFWTIEGGGGSATQLIIEITANSGVNSFGIFDAADSSKVVELYSGSASSGSKVGLSFNDSFEVETNNIGQGITFADNLFGFYLDTPNGVFYSDAGLNSDSSQQMVAYRGNGTDQIKLPNSPKGVFNPDDYIFGWEDTLLENSDIDYNDFVVSASSISPVPTNVPEPSELALAIFGLALIGVGVVARRSHRTDPTLAI